MRIMNNISAMNAHRLYTNNNSKLSKSLEKLSSGYAINRAGDNAAGLAVSEKMRAQIAGLEQASKNAQDGISMVQTYEGALTESDSILQRMRSLAVQSANGTYDNSVDRVAIEQEFKQLNDELNQIADTDFNGVVVLNGGVMADGIKAVNGVFDYTNSVRAAKTLGSSDINLLDYQQIDDYDNSKGTTKADVIWDEISGSKWNRKDDSTENNGPESVEVTYQYDSATNKWTAIKATGGADLTKFAAKANPADNGTGGFKAETTAGVEIANVVLEKTDLVNGDTITLKINNPANSTSIPSNGGAEVIDDSSFKESTVANSTKLQDADLTITMGTKDEITAAMSEDVNALFNALNGATVEAKYDGGATEAGDLVLTLNDAAGTTIKSDSGTFTIGNTTFKVAANDVTGIKITTNDDKLLYQIDMTSQTATANGSSGSVKYKLAVDQNEYDKANMPTVEVVSDANKVSVSNSRDASTAKLTYANGMSLQVGARTKDLVDFTFAYDADSIGTLKADLDCSARGLGTDKLTLATQEDANAAIDKIDHAINKISMVRGTFGSIQNRLEHKISNLDTNNENLTAAESRIRDTDMAAEMMEFTKNQILSQASQSMLAQANQLPQGVLSLLQ